MLCIVDCNSVLTNKVDIYYIILPMFYKFIKRKLKKKIVICLLSLHLCICINDGYTPIIYIL